MNTTIYANLVCAVRGIKNWFSGGAVKVLVVAAAIAVAGAALAEEYNDGTYTWTYQDHGDSVELFKESLKPAVDPKPSGTVEIPPTIDGKPVTRIGSYAFYGCSDLTGVEIPATVTSIGWGTFMGTKLHDVTVPNNVRSIEGKAFANCPALSCASFPARFVDALSTSSYVFENSANVEVLFRENVDGIDWQFQVVGGKAEVRGASDSAIPRTTAGDIAIPMTLGGYPVGRIGDYAFYKCESLTGVTIPICVETIGKAFIECSSLKSIVIPYGVEKIVENTFYKCTSLESVTLYGTIDYEAIDVSADAFKECSSLKKFHVVGELDPSIKSMLTTSGFEVENIINSEEIDGIEWKFWINDGKAEICSGTDDPAISDTTLDDITVPSTLGGYPVASIGPRAFALCDSLAYVTIPGGVTSIGHSAFGGCSALLDVDMPASVTRIADDAFQGCESYTVDGFVIIRGVLYYFDDTDDDVEIPDEVTRIADAAFADWYSIKRVEIPASVRAIGRNSFSGCSVLSTLIIEDGVVHIGEGAFSGCKKVEEVSIPPSVRSVGEWAFSACLSLKSVEMPKSVASIGEDAFNGCNQLADVHVQPGDTDRVRGLIEDSGYDTSGLNFIEDLPEKFKVTFDPDGGVVSPAYIDVPSGEMIAAMPTPTYEGYVFWGWFSYADDELVLPTTVPTDNMDLYAEWKSADEWGKWTDADGIEWKYRIIDGEAEIYNDGDPAIPADTAGVVKVPSMLGGCPVTHIGDHAFEECVALTDVILPPGIVRIGSEAFFGCESLKNMQLQDGLESIGDYAFVRCVSLTTTAIPGTVTDIGPYAFEECTSLTSVYVMDGVTALGWGMFSDCTNLKNVQLPESLKSIAYTVFSGCEKLLNINLPNGVADIWEYAFSGCESLKSILIPPAVTSIRAYTFSNCSSLTDVTVPGGVEDIGNFAFTGCSGLNRLTIESGVKHIGSSSFANCRKMTEMSIPKSVESIEEYAFQGCHELKTVYVSMGDTARVKQMLEDALLDTAGLTFVEQEYEMWTDADGVQWCYRIVDGEAEIYKGEKQSAIPRKTEGSVTVPSTLGGCPVTAIGDYAFLRCGKLTGATIPDGVKRIGTYAFYACSALSADDLHLPSSVTSVGDRAFWGCRAMADTSGFVIVRNVLFYYAGSAAEVAIPDRVTGISSAAFSGNETLTDVIVPSGVTKIGTSVFRNCTSLKSATIPASVTIIGKSTFEGSALATVYVEKGDTEHVRSLIKDTDYDVDKINFVEPVDVFKVTFNANGGTCAEGTRDVEDGAEVGTLPPATRAGCVLAGWFTGVDDGDPVSAETVVTADVTFYAHWTSDSEGDGAGGEGDGAGGESGGAGGESGGAGGESGGAGGESGGAGGKGGGDASVSPDVPCYVILDASEITAPYAAPTAKKLYGALYGSCDAVGIIELKLGKVNVRKKSSKVSGTVTLTDGKKYKIKAKTVAVDGISPVTVALDVNKLGVMTLTIGGDKFAGTLGNWHVQPATVGGIWGSSAVTAYVDVRVGDLSKFQGRVLDFLLPYEEKGFSNGMKWTFNKVAGVKWTKLKTGMEPVIQDAVSGKGLVVDTLKDKTNLSAMKLTYAAKKGTFNGSFKVCELQGLGKSTKLKKCVVKVTGVVVNGVGYGSAKCTKPAFTWSVTVK